MQSMYFHEIMILSKTEKKALRVEFSKKKNLIIGENDVGKSTLIKSLYHALGADTPQLNTSRWSRANAIYALKFSIKGNTYTFIRDEQYFGVFDAQDQLLGQYKGISREGGISDFLNPLLNFNVELETSDDDLRRLSPAYYFLPFYVDQDEGWNKTWTSFKGLQGIKNYRTKMIDYHLGIRSQKYYDAKRDEYNLKTYNDELNDQKNSLITVRDRFKDKKYSLNLDIDPVAFKNEIDELVDRYNEHINVQEKELNKIKSKRSQRLNLVNEIHIIEKTIKELDGDYRYCESAETPDIVDCPTCGTEFENSIADRFGILDDIDYCYSLIDQRKKDLMRIDEELEKLNQAYNKLENEENKLKTLLQRKKEKVTFAEFITAEGCKEMMKTISSDITDIDSKQADNDQKILDLKQDIRLDSKLKKDITEYYQKRMKFGLNLLNVHVLTEDNYNTPSKLIKINATGSDLPRSLLAQYYSFLHVMNKYNSFVTCPLVIDSPFQQEQDAKNSPAILNFILSNAIENQQLILGTVSVDNIIEDQTILDEVKIIEFKDKYSLLSADLYEDVLADIGTLHEKTLQVQN